MVELKFRQFLYWLAGLAVFFAFIWWFFARTPEIKTVVAKAVTKSWVAGHSGYSTRTGNVMQYIPPSPGRYTVNLRTDRGNEFEVTASEAQGQNIKVGKVMRVTYSIRGIPGISPLNEVVEIDEVKAPKNPGVNKQQR